MNTEDDVRVASKEPLLEARWLMSLQTNDSELFMNTYATLSLPPPANEPSLSRSAARYTKTAPTRTKGGKPAKRSKETQTAVKMGSMRRENVK